MDFTALPPEINSGRMYAGPGSGSLLTAAAAWDELATELYTAAANYGSVVSELAGGAWQGASSTSMASAAAPYVAWMNTTAAQAEQTGAQAKAAATAHASAYAMTVPPPEIAANRALLSSLVATNLLGQNTPAIAATEAHYGEMWAQDATAMLGYATAAQSASQVSPFTPPQQNTNPNGLATQGAATTQAAGTSAGHAAATQVMSALPQAAGDIPGLDSLGSLSDIWALPQDALFDTAIIAAFFPEYALAGAGLPSPFGLSEAAPAAVAAAEPLGLTPTLAAPASSSLVGAPVSASLGEAASVSRMSVPQAWANAAPEMRLAAAEFPTASVVAAEGSGGMFGGMPLMGQAPLMTLGGSGTAGSRNTKAAQEEAKRKAAKGRRSTMH
ncbi:PPE family protein [Mycobacterium sp. pUA109]|uniref:PPE family protein n=1 Tax=Mycobacterium sp. pUA109 TaxID=3238982 RepID=UPI00351B1C1A